MTDFLLHFGFSFRCSCSVDSRKIVLDSIFQYRICLFCSLKCRQKKKDIDGRCTLVMQRLCYIFSCLHVINWRILIHVIIIMLCCYRDSLNNGWSLNNRWIIYCRYERGISSWSVFSSFSSNLFTTLCLISKWFF